LATANVNFIGGSEGGSFGVQSVLLTLCYAK
jgi:hypothetical protein